MSERKPQSMDHRRSLFPKIPAMGESELELKRRIDALLLELFGKEARDRAGGMGGANFRAYMQELTGETIPNDAIVACLQNVFEALVRVKADRNIGDLYT